MKGTIFEHSRQGKRGPELPALDVPAVDPASALGPEAALRKGPIGLPEVTENEVMRHYVTVSVRNYHLERGMYPLGSCTMKYNPKLHETLARLPGLCGLHPSLPDHAVQGTLEIMHRLGEALCEITGFEAVTLQPAAGAQGELTGLLLIRSYHVENGQDERREILMPDSAHGTNPASCALAGMHVINVGSNERGEVDVEDLASKVGPRTAGLMLTNPNTLGIFESRIEEIAAVVHGAGGLVYMDGANMNALMGIARPGDMGFDVCHLNLHKTFSTPHGGGGPGSGPVACIPGLAPFLPGPCVRRREDGSYELAERATGIGRMLAWHGQIGVLYKAWAYIRSLGAEGLREVSENAVLNANYLRARLRERFELPYAVEGRHCMHEFVLSGDRQAARGVKTLDMAKRLLDYGLHAPTVYFPLIVHEALMVEPTETESLESLDAFVEAMLSIAREVDEEPGLVTDAPVNTPVLRLDEVRAARDLDVVLTVEAERLAREEAGGEAG
ncbi:aminomethyl-transferring glycine dehydrogenase subunit GcvPB [Candidatus Fermentibacterales bacterium]|nr:aminomethyl-transferring glycine dehydrogenase subunit GcvPB [Candidatus Fermentibacterales bacterium]